jgi:hypothetical protein
MNQDHLRDNIKNAIHNAVDVLLKRDKFITTDGGPVAQEYRLKRSIIEAYQYAVLFGAIELTDMVVADSPLIAEWYRAIIVQNHQLTDSSAMLAGVLMECVDSPSEAHKIIHHYTK